jgi:hypothetical protein
MYRYVRDLLTILPGSNKTVIDISSQYPADILKQLDLVTDEHDTVVLTNADVWRYFDLVESIVNHSNLQHKKVFLQTLGYANTKLTDRSWEISCPLFYWTREKSTTEFVAKPSNLKHGFSCLNNKNNMHRTLLGYWLYRKNLLGDIIFSQNIVNDGQAFSQIAKHMTGLGFKDFDEYKKLLPIRYNESSDANINFATDHSISHDAYTKAYCNIVTESECEEYPYEKNINLPIVTEKSYKPFLAGQVPIMLAARGHIAHLKSLGFEMMEELLPSDYDQANPWQKIKAIRQVVSQGSEFMEDFYFGHLREIQHNYELVNSDKVEKVILQKIKDIL